MSLLPYFFLVIAILFSLHKTRQSALIALTISIVCGLIFARIQPIGLIWIALLAVSLWAAMKDTLLRSARALGFVSFVLLAGGLSNHLLPGFSNLLIFDKVQFSSDSIPFTLYLNFDKALVGFFICLLFIPRDQRTDFGKKDTRLTLKVLALLLAVMIPLSLWTGYVRFDPKQPLLTWLWVFNNLFFVCLAEEAFFRGFIQGGLSRLLSKVVNENKSGPTKKGTAICEIAPLFTGAILFGLAHYKGGLTYVAFATLAGLFYGYAYLKTKKITSAIFVHFGLNLVHFLFFSYPALMSL